MEELPKIVRHRLAHPAKQDAASAPDMLRGATHPDANLLSAFVERSLSEEERTAVLGHLAGCAECRELVSLAFPTSEVQAALNEVPAPARAGRRWQGWPLWLGWRTLRWGVLAASVAVVMVGAFRSGVLKRPTRRNSARTTTVAENRLATSVVAPAPSPSTERYGVISAPAARARGARSHQEIAANKEAVQSESLMQQRDDSRALAKRKSPVPPSTPASRLADERQYDAEQAMKVPSGKDRSVPVDNATRANRNERPPVTANEPGISANSAAAVGGAAKTGSMERDLDKKSPGISEEVEVQAQAATREKKADQLGAQNAQASSLGQAMAPPPAPPATREQSEQRPASGLSPRSAAQDAIGAQRQQVHASGAPKAAMLLRGAPPAYWSISASGKLELSLAADGPWHELHVDDSVKFRVVTAEGNDVWAGGSGGALYHSTSGGAHWARVTVGPNQAADQAVVTDAIVSLHFSDPEHGTVVTEAHERWITADSGVHWAPVR